MIRKFLVIAVVSLLFAGCTEGLTNFDASISVSTVSVSNKDGLCGYSDGEECHAVFVVLANDGNDDVSTARYYWEAQSENGGVFTSPDVDGPDACAPEGVCELTLKFSVSEGETLTKLVWDGTFNEMDTEIPEY